MQSPQQEGAASQEVYQDCCTVRDLFSWLEALFSEFLLAHFGFVHHSCKEYRNLNAFFAIIMGLSNPAVSRLSQTWEVGVNMNHKKLEIFGWW